MKALATPLAAVLAVAAFGAGSVAADMCSTDAVPAATLLVPYFEADLANPDCVTTLFSINNASADPALAHVTFWTDWSQPTIDFEIFLTGYDVVTVNVRDVFEGNLPITADLQSDPGDSISPAGDPAWDGSFQDCENFFPFYQNPLVTGANLDRLVNGHLGRPVASNGGLCMGQSHDDELARGYITIDNVTRCSLEFPGDAGYFGGPDPVVSNVNQLWGDWYIADPPNGAAFGESLVHIEAQDGFTDASTPSGYTFYGRYALGGVDNREPLATTHAVRYLNGGPFSGGTDLFVWRDSTTADTAGGYACGTGPSWYPMNETEIVAFDESENAVQLCAPDGQVIISPPPPFEDPVCFPLETQRVSVGEGNLAVPYEFGWLFLNMNLNDFGVTADVDFGSFGTLAQSYVAAAHSASGLYQVGMQSVQLTHACEDVDFIVGASGGGGIPE